MNLELTKIKSVKMVIFQPRISHEPVEWVCDIKKLGQFATCANLAVLDCKQANKESLGIQSKFFALKWAEKHLNPTEKGCRWCKAKANCPALAKACLQNVSAIAEATDEGLEDEGSHAISVVPANVSDSVQRAIGNVPSLDFATVTRIYRAKKLFSEWLEAIETRMLSELLNGTSCADFKLVQSRGGHRKWRDNDEAEEAMKAMRLKVDEMYDKKIISPTNAEKLLKKRPKLWPKLKALIVKAEGGPTIAPINDKRLAINPQYEVLEEIPDQPPEFELDDLI